MVSLEIDAIALTVGKVKLVGEVNSAFTLGISNS